MSTKTLDLADTRIPPPFETPVDTFALNLFTGQAASAINLAGDALAAGDFKMAHDQLGPALVAVEEILRLRGEWTEAPVERKPWNAEEDIEV